MESNRTSRWRIKTKYWLLRYCGGKCQKCGYDRYYGNLTFHHILDKREEISRMIAATVAIETIIEEVSKCVLLCTICHGEAHAGLIECPPINTEERAENLKLMWSEKPVKKSNTLRPCAKCEKLTTALKYCSASCSGLASRKIDWPESEILSKMVWEETVTSIALSLGVSDKAVKKHCKKLNINTPPLGYWNRKSAP